MGTISTLEFKRRAIINEINYLTFDYEKTSKTRIPLNFSRFRVDEILAMEIDPKESRWYVHLICIVFQTYFICLI